MGAVERGRHYLPSIPAIWWMFAVLRPASCSSRAQNCSTRFAPQSPPVPRGSHRAALSRNRPRQTRSIWRRSKLRSTQIDAGPVTGRRSKSRAQIERQSDWEFHRAACRPVRHTQRLPMIGTDAPDRQAEISALPVDLRKSSMQPVRGRESQADASRYQ